MTELESPNLLIDLNVRILEQYKLFLKTLVLFSDEKEKNNTKTSTTLSTAKLTCLFLLSITKCCSKFRNVEIFVFFEQPNQK